MTQTTESPFCEHDYYSRDEMMELLEVGPDKLNYWKETLIPREAQLNRYGYTWCLCEVINEMIDAGMFDPDRLEDDPDDEKYRSHENCRLLPEHLERLKPIYRKKVSETLQEGGA